MIVAFACDHGGFLLREKIIAYIKKNGHEVLDFGPQTFDPLDDFPEYVPKVCNAVLVGKAEKGILVCGTGIGMSISANRFPGIRAVLAYSPEIAKISRSHNDANVICFGARTMDVDNIFESIDIFFTEAFLGHKYQRRNEKMDCQC